MAGGFLLEQTVDFTNDKWTHAKLAITYTPDNGETTQVRVFDVVREDVEKKMGGSVQFEKDFVEEVQETFEGGLVIPDPDARTISFYPPHSIINAVITVLEHEPSESESDQGE